MILQVRQWVHLLYFTKPSCCIIVFTLVPFYFVMIYTGRADINVLVMVVLSLQVTLCYFVLVLLKAINS